ncbi:MAG TPA: single-stranded-DNA-specific exonuclease RecJ [Steroidobacteraceae bacterium]|nr:single-stranded-DNA-specific exonuclease RecJ [Steroidobacteraceae bacterium]
MNKHIIRKPLPSGSLSSLHAMPLLQRIYALRGVRDASELELSLDKLIPVSELHGVQQAVDLLLHHHAQHSRIMIVGDFDTDGATSTALMVRQLRRLGFDKVDYLVPNRFKYGYGLTPEIVELAAQRGPQLIITVDNGMSSISGVAAANALGIEVLITDHHLAGAELPQAVAIVNPNAPDSTFASKSLAGVGVAFYVMAALTRAMQSSGLVSSDNTSVAALLDLVALGTVADVVPLDFNNRILVAQGLKRIRAGRCVPGIRALLAVANKRLETCVASDLGFQVGPRLNAAGRLDDMRLGIECLLADDESRARMMAAQLNQLNLDRRDIEQQMQADAMVALNDMQLNDETLPLGLCLYDESWHQGVIGLVASRIKERVHRPVVAMARADDHILKGSARSVQGVHIRDVLDAIASRHPGLIDKFGGHAMAAGLSIHAVNLDAFKAAFDDEVQRWMTHDDAVGVVHSDGELQSADFSIETARCLREAGPWGQHFPEPVFDGEFGVVESRVLGDRHLKLKVKAGDGVCEALAFRYFDHDDAVPINANDQVHLAYRLDVNEYQGAERMQLVVEQLQKV